MKAIIKIFAPLVILFATVFITPSSIYGQTSVAKDYSHLYKDLPFQMKEVELPVFPLIQVNIKDFGAKGDGITSNTKAIAAAIDAVSKKGGGTVVIPEGVWLTGPIVLKNNICIDTKKGALVIFSKNRDEYPLVKTWYEGLESWRAMAPIFADKAENIAIIGEGIFDGSGEVWRPVKKFQMTDAEWKAIIASGGTITSDGKTWHPDSSALQGSIHNTPRGEMDLQIAKRTKTFLRPVMLNLISCKKILIEGITIQNTPSWGLHPVLCDQIIFNNVKVYNEDWVVNGDALDLESCKNALVTNCLFDAGDDGICIKSGRDKEGRKRGVPTENVIISNCIVYSGHGGFVIGSEMSGGARNIKVSHCTFMGTDNGLRFKSTRGRGGLVENIYISDINMINIQQDAILFDLYYFVKERSSVVPPVDETTPQFRNIFLKDIVCKGAQRAILLQGLPEMNLNNINLKNVTIESRTGAYCSDATQIAMKNITLLTTTLPAIQIKNVKEMDIRELKLNQGANATLIDISGEKTQNVTIQGGNFNQEAVSIGKEVRLEGVKISK